MIWLHCHLMCYNLHSYQASFMPLYFELPNVYTASLHYRFLKGIHNSIILRFVWHHFSVISLFCQYIFQIMQFMICKNLNFTLLYLCICYNHVLLFHTFSLINLLNDHILFLSVDILFICYTTTILLDNLGCLQNFLLLARKLWWISLFILDLLHYFRMNYHVGDY